MQRPTDGLTTRDEILGVLRSRWNELSKEFGVRRLALFGSAARDSLVPDSDVDILVVFEQRSTFDGFMDLKFRLEELLGRRVDLVTDKALRPRIATIVARECVDVA